MSISVYRSAVERLERDIATLQGQLSREESKEAGLLSRISYLQRSITSRTSASTRKSKSSEIERKQKELVKVAKKKADLAKNLATKSKELTRKRAQLRKEETRQHDQGQRLQRQYEPAIGQGISVLGAETVGPQTRLAVQANPEAILSEVFVLEAETDQNMTQGTCFNLTGVGLVTCDHILGLGQDLVAFHPSQPTKKHPVEVLSRNDVIDLARIRVPDLEVGDGLPHGSADDLQMADKILVAGYPNYRLGDTGTVTPGSITGFRMVSSIRRMLVDTPIIAGASGGPVLDDEGQAIGVAVTGADRMEDAGSTENHGVVPIDALDRI